MKHQLNTKQASMDGFIALTPAIVMAAIVLGAGVLVYEWHQAHPAKDHTDISAHHHHHKHQAKVASADTAEKQ